MRGLRDYEWSIQRLGLVNVCLKWVSQCATIIVEDISDIFAWISYHILTV